MYDGHPSGIGKRLKMINLVPKPNEPELEFFIKIIDKDDMRVNVMEEKSDGFISGKE